MLYLLLVPHFPCSPCQARRVGSSRPVAEGILFLRQRRGPRIQQSRGKNERRLRFLEHQIERMRWRFGGLAANALGCTCDENGA